ncbi:MAG: hypothetical protein NXI20_24890 [bacterium]|nr:hypothetical protein [bacterium]
MKRILTVGLIVISFQAFSQVSNEPNPNGPKELSQFNFLLGDWNVLGETLNAEGSYTEWSATWKGYYLQSGYIFADEFEVPNGQGGFYFAGTTYRMYNPEKQEWQMCFADALKGKWATVFHGKFNEEGAKFIYNNSDRQGAFLGIIKFYNITEKSFNWSLDKSYDNGQTWIYQETKMTVTRK